MNPPNTAYVLLWFPKPSETFVFREVMTLWDLQMPIRVFTLYGELKKSLSPEMQSVSHRMERLGLPYIPQGLKEWAYWWRKDSGLVKKLFKTLALRPPVGLEKTGENLWAFNCAFRLARRFQELGIEHIHAPWASGPATAAWIASRLTGIPFSFTARAWDVYPPDNVLKDKVRDAAFVRSETGYNIDFLKKLTGEPAEKFHLTYNGVPLQAKGRALVDMKPPYRLFALGRFVGKKGYEYLLQALKMLKDNGEAYHLTLAGDGPLMASLKQLTSELGLTDDVTFPGFVPHDRVSELFQAADIFVMPSVVHSSGDRDGIPLVLMEAMLHRLPVVATDVSGIPELVKDGENGYLIREKDPQAIVDALRRLTADRDNALDMAEAGQARILDQFEPLKNYKNVLGIYTRYHQEYLGAN